MALGHVVGLAKRAFTMREMAVHDARNGRSRWSETTVHDAAKSAFTMGRSMQASRARAKLVVLVSKEVVNHLPKDPEVLRQSALLKTYTETYCDKSRPMRLGIVGVQPHVVNGTFRWR
jgi:hypothetical protein